MSTSRFADYCRRKTAAAQVARLSGFVTSSGPTPAARGLVEIRDAWTSALFDGPFFRSPAEAGLKRPTIGLVFVQSLEGNTVVDDPASLGGGATDAHLIYEGLSRVDADAVLAGARTAAGGDLVFSVWHPRLVQLRLDLGRERHPAQVVVTERGELPVESALLYNEPSLRVIVITGGAAAARVRSALHSRSFVEVVDAGTPLNLVRAMETLYARGLQTISAVGGRATAAALAGAGLVSDLYLTTAGRSGGEPGTPLFDGRWPAHDLVVAKRGRGAERGTRFEHFVFRP